VGYLLKRFNQVFAAHPVSRLQSRLLIEREIVSGEKKKKRDNVQSRNTHWSNEAAAASQMIEKKGEMRE
jgi:hypothetical protein